MSSVDVSSVQARPFRRSQDLLIIFKVVWLKFPYVDETVQFLDSSHTLLAYIDAYRI